MFSVACKSLYAYKQHVLWATQWPKKCSVHLRLFSPEKAATWAAETPDGESGSGSEPKLPQCTTTRAKLLLLQWSRFLMWKGST